MGAAAYNENKFEATRSKSYPSMENLSDKFSGLGVNGSSNSNDGLFQVIKAVEAAESTIKHQAEENNSLRVALQRRTEELERFKSDNSTAPRSHSDILGEEHNLGPYNEHQSVLHTGNQASEASLLDLHQTLIPHQSLMLRKEDCIPHARAESEDCFERPAYATLKMVSTGRTTADCGASSRISSPSSRSLASSRYREEEYDLKFNLPGHGKITPKANNDNTLWNQDLFVKVREHEEEISQLRKHLADRAMKEAQIRNEKYVLEKRIADMRLAFDQQQQEIVEASSKAISYRQDIIEENIRLTYALQAAHQEISTYLSSMLPLLADYSLQPSTSDAQSIACNIKVLFKHLQEKLLVTEAKLKDSHYQLTPLGSDSLNHPSSTPQSPYRSIGTGATSLHRDMHDPIPQSYSRGEAQFSSADAQTPTAWDRMAFNTHPSGLVGLPEKNLEQDKWGRSSPISRITQDIPASPVAQRDSHAKHFNVGTMGTQLSFKDLVTSSESDSEAVYYQNGREHSPHYQNGREHLPHYQNGREDSPHYQHGREPLPHWGSRNSPYMDRTPDDPNSASPHLPPVHEETSSSFSEEDDPLPGIEGLQISGEALPGRELQACGYSINGTTSCNFEWVRYLEDGSVNYIDGAKQPNYLVTADDVDSYLAIEVQPLDNRKRKGELVKVFANDQRKITCDSEMQERLEKTLYSGHASFEVSLAAGYLEIWEHAILAIKRVGYSIKCNGPRGVVVTEKFSPRTDIVIPYGHASTFTIIGAGGIEHLLRTNDDSQLRDIIVLTMRLFIMRAVEKRSGKRKKGRLFFNK